MRKEINGFEDAYILLVDNTPCVVGLPDNLETRIVLNFEHDGRVSLIAYYVYDKDTGEIVSAFERG